MAPEWTYEAAEWFHDFIGRSSPADLVLLALLSVVGLPATILVHELGHALAARARGLRVRKLVVGDTADVVVTAPGFRLQLGRFRGHGDVGGYVEHEAAGPGDVLIVAAAGPLASFLGALATAALAAELWSHGMVSAVLWLYALLGAVSAVENLVPSGRPGEPDSLSDGAWIAAAWHVLRDPSPPAHEHPNAETSVAPPGYEA